jgi:hypothetical protein
VATAMTVNSERAQEDRADKGEHREHRQHVELQGKVHVAFSASFWMLDSNRALTSF